MKFLTTLLMASFISATALYAGEVKVKAVMTTGPDDEPTTSFAANTEKIYALFKTKGISDGDKIRGVWIADDVGDAAPANTKIDEKTLTLKGDTDDGDFSLSKPTKGWPAGQYHLDIYVNDDKVTSAKFTIGESKVAAKKKEKAEEASDEDYSFKVHNTTKDKIKKLLASEDGKEW